LSFCRRGTVLFKILDKKWHRIAHEFIGHSQHQRRCKQFAKKIGPVVVHDMRVADIQQFKGSHDIDTAADDDWRLSLSSRAGRFGFDEMNIFKKLINVGLFV